MLNATHLLALMISTASLLLPAFAQEPEKRQPNEAAVILKDAQKQDAVTPKEITDCEKQWSASTQMTKEEWAASCRNTLRYFPEKP